jgi:uncharacterized RDD family membrane protein YckC
MKCPECGATLKKISRKCSECGALLKKKVDISLSKKPGVIESAPAVSGKQAITLESAPTVSAQQTITLESAPTVSAQQTTTHTETPSLIEFPGINKNALPEWRKELSERVREKQERRAREAVLEAQGVVTSSVDTTPIAQPILELLPQTEMPPLNPIVEAALKRIERAHLESTSFSRGNAALATAVAYEGQPVPAESDVASLFESSAVDSENKAPAEARPAEKTHNLAVVPNPTMTKEAAGTLIKKPKRLIGETNDPALDYLDTVPTALLVESRQYVAVSAARRALAAIVDLAIMFALSSPLLALNGLTELNWQNWRVIAFSAGGIMLLGFFYLTIVTALTGRTVGMRLCSLRVVDARNGLIPTGSQSAGRALIYLLSLASAGILSLYVFVDSQRHTLQDRFTRTTVIRA